MEGISYLQPTLHNVAYSLRDAYPTITGLVWLGLVWLGLLNVAILEVMRFGGCDLGDRWWIFWCPWFWTYRSSEVVSFGCYGLGVFNTHFHMQITSVTTQGLFGDFSMEVFFNGARKIARFPCNQKSVSTILDTPRGQWLPSAQG